MLLSTYKIPIIIFLLPFLVHFHLKRQRKYKYHCDDLTGLECIDSACPCPDFRLRWHWLHWPSDSDWQRLPLKSNQEGKHWIGDGNVCLCKSREYDLSKRDFHFFLTWKKAKKNKIAFFCLLYHASLIHYQIIEKRNINWINLANFLQKVVAIPIRHIKKPCFLM